MLSPITSGGTPLVITVRKITSTSATEDIGTLNFVAGVPADLEAIDHTFAQYDVLAFFQTSGAGSTGASDIGITAMLHQLD